MCMEYILYDSLTCTTLSIKQTVLSESFCSNYYGQTSNTKQSVASITPGT